MKKLILSYELAWRTQADKKFMKSAEWKRIRKIILERDNHTCQYCGVQRKEYMQINHIDGNPKNHDHKNLEVICSSCHKITHSGFWAQVHNILDVYEKSKYNQNDIIRITGEMRNEGKSDEQIIKHLGLEEKVTWQEDLEFLAARFGFITSRKMNKQGMGVTLTEDEQQESLKNRENW